MQHDKIVSDLIDVIDDFVIVCNSKGMLAEKGIVTLGNYYNTPHAVYCVSDSRISEYSFSGDDRVDKERNSMKRVAYYSSSITGVISAIERKDMISILPRRVCEHLICNFEYKLTLLPLPDEINCKAHYVYASYNKLTAVKAKKIISILKSINPQHAI